jgi:hypothetical protein
MYELLQRSRERPEETNTGCVPSREDDVFVFRPDGTLAPAAGHVINGCDWSGDFTVSGRYQPQDCDAH